MDECLNYVEKLIGILDRKTIALRNKVVNLVKVKWQHRRSSEWTWEQDDEMRKHYPYFFMESNFEDKV